MTLSELLEIALRYRNKVSDAMILACYEAAAERGEHLSVTQREGGDTNGNDNRLPGQGDSRR